ncbi:MAG: aspartate aminotransferase family protein [Acidobacteria bacterium]|nr:aspartate aminotransferase family protein [Acidobacteriota bacterium]
MSGEQVFERLRDLRRKDAETRGGRAWGLVYDSGLEEAREVAERAYVEFLGLNALDPTAFPSVLRLENEVVAMAIAHLGGGAGVVGNFTSGGTESCFLAVKTARDHARATRPEVARPEVILPITAHPAFHKACHYLGLTAVPTAVDPETFKADAGAVARAVSPSTIMIVGSAVSYAHGVLDPIAEMAAVARERGLWLHVDGCIGGFLLPYYRRLGRAVGDFDFTVEGVSSMSMDLHKYAYAPKGASVVLYRSKALRKYQLYACASWPGYPILNTTVQSTKPGGPIAAAWATLNFIGDEGYLRLARLTLEATERLIAGISGIPRLRVLGRTDTSLIAFASEDVNVFYIADEMKRRGWLIPPQPSFGPSPASLHLIVTASSLPQVDAFLADLRTCVEAAAGRGLRIDPALRDTLAALDPSSLTDEMLSRVVGAAGVEWDALEDSMADVNSILDSLPPQVREALLIAGGNELFTPAK